MKLYPADPAHAGVDAPEKIVSGFGTVMMEERELRALLRSGLVHGQGSRPLELGSAFNRRDAQIDAIISLLEKRQAQLPAPLRFQALEASVSPRTHVHPPQRMASATVAQLMALNQRLINSIEVLRTVSGRRDGAEPILASVAQRHAELAWTLAALVQEDEFVQEDEDWDASD